MVENEVVEGDIVSKLCVEELLVSLKAWLEDTVVECLAQDLHRLQLDFVL